MGNIRHCRPSDLLVPVDITPSQMSSDVLYPPTSMFNRNPAYPAKFDGTDLELILDLGSQIRVDGFGIPNSNIDELAVCTLQLNNVNSWGSPSIDTTVNFGLDAKDGHKASPWENLTGVAGYSISGFRYIRLVVPTNSVNIKIGELLIMKVLRSFTRWPQFDGSKGAQRRFLEHLETEYGVERVLRRRIRQRTLSAVIKMSDADVTDLNDLLDDAGGTSQPFFVTFDHTLFTDGGLFVRFTKEIASESSTQEAWYDVNPFTFSVRELSRSLPL